MKDCADHLAFVPTQENKADPLTKALTSGDYMKMLNAHVEHSYLFALEGCERVLAYYVDLDP